MATISRLPLWACLILLIAGTLQVASANTQPRSKGCTGYPGASGCAKWTCDKHTCTGKCDKGYLPAQATCLPSGKWNITRDCGCKGTPVTHTGCQKWTCTNYACTGTCEWGMPAQAKCLPTGAWNVTQTCTPKPQVCATQPPACNGGSWPDCRNKSVCIGYCGKGFTGSVKADCIKGAWVVSNQCKVDSGCKGCRGLPTAVTGISWSPRCDGKSYCGANCMTGYCEGYVYSKCIDGKWSTPVGSCKPVVAAPPKKCYGKPKICNLAGKWKCHHGKKCTAKCSWGCSGGYTAKCVDGKWVVSGKCSYKKWWIAKYHH